MPERILVDGTGYELTVTSEDELLRGLAHLHQTACEQGTPILATIFANGTDEDPPRLGIGLGRDDSVLVYSAGGWTGEGGVSVRASESRTESAGTVRDGGDVAFRYGTTINEYPAWMLIPLADAYTAAAEFFGTAQQPTSVAWAQP